jgi:AcrR family transcriptional regulator
LLSTDNNRSFRIRLTLNGCYDFRQLLGLIDLAGGEHVPRAEARSVRGPYRTGIRRREQIVQSASIVFAEFGYSGGSIRTIAERVGASPATLIQHFGSKEGLLQAVLDDWDRQTAELLASGGRTGLAYFEALHELMTFHLQHRALLELFVTMTAEATSTSHPAHDFIRHHYAVAHKIWAEQLRAARDRDEIGPLSGAQIEAEIRQLIAVADGLEIQWLLDPSVDLHGLFKTYLDQTTQRWVAGRPVRAPQASLA